MQEQTTQESRIREAVIEAFPHYDTNNTGGLNIWQLEPFVHEVLPKLGDKNLENQ